MFFLITLAWGWFLLLALVLMFVGFQVGSVVEYKKQYNFADLELDLLRSLEAQARAERKAVTAESRAFVQKIVAGANRLEFWKKK